MRPWRYIGTMASTPQLRIGARGSPLALVQAEMVRDQALALSGLLVEKVGGPSVKTYQPAGLWEEVEKRGKFKRGNGEDLYRRSLYTNIRRTVAPPSMLLFDMPSREVCTVERARTNTPLQALVLMNETAFFEAARALAGHQDQILEELNVKSIEFIARDAGLVNYRIKPNLPRLGKLYGKLLRQIR